METPAPPTLADRICRLIRTAEFGVGSRWRADSILGPALAAALLALICARLSNLRHRFVSLFERMQAGTLPKLPEPGQAPKRKRAATSAALKPDPEHRVRESWGWLVNIARHHALASREELQRLLDDKETQAMIAAEPRRMGRLLRPLCRMFGVDDMPDLLRLPSQAHVVTVDWAAVAKMVDAEKAAHAAGLPPPVWPQPPQPARIRKQPPFRFYITSHGPPLRA
ncbi:MAG TPA: hypothetical protein VHS58_04135 [Acetobacteraceae bacterium]|jgi:hypothetical protein|nr:hypothetical protein [Acetobacteraceae bacterium]